MNAILARIGVFAIAIVVAFGVGFGTAARHYSNAATIAKLNGQIEAAGADLAASAAASGLGAQQGVSQEKSSNENQVQVNDLANDVSARKDRGACRLSDADAERLRGIK